MPFSASYDYYYNLGATAPTAGFSVPNVTALPVSNTITDDVTPPDDGDLAPGDGVSWTASSAMEYYGQTDDGDPFLYDTVIGTYYLLSNNGALYNTTVGFNATTYTMCFAAGTRIATPVG